MARLNSIYQPLQSVFRVGLVAALLAACGCSVSARDTNPEQIAQERRAALAVAVKMPDPALYEARYLDWQDPSRKRDVNTKLYLPKNSNAPIVVFSHGIGGSREGYSYIGQYLAANGIASLHLQHVGSDRSLWTGNPLSLVTRLQIAAQDSEAIARVQDLSFALDKLLAQADLVGRIDPQRIAAAGHSYGANTTMLAIGANVSGRRAVTQNLVDRRIKAAIIISAPPFYGETDLKSIVGGIAIPTLHITSTGDEIQVPGYYSPPKDRVDVFEAMSPGGAKALAVFTGGSHSMFTDRLGTGGLELNPRIKEATRQLCLAFLHQIFIGTNDEMAQWYGKNQALLARYEKLDR